MARLIKAEIVEIENGERMLVRHYADGRIERLPVAPKPKPTRRHILRIRKLRPRAPVRKPDV
jgi:hypothetical protein